MRKLPVMPADHIEQLRRVDLHLWFGRHGQLGNIAGHGPAILDVETGDYQQALSMLDDLSPDRGDTLATEYAEYDNELPHVFDYLKDFQTTARESAYVNWQDAEIIGRYQGTSPVPGIALDQEHFILPDMLTSTAEQAGRYQIIPPNTYANLIGISQGLPFYYADATRAELEQFHQERGPKSSTEPDQPLLLFLKNLIAEAKYRDTRIVPRLGEIASNMQIQDKSDPPHLIYSAGIGHSQGITRILDAYEVPFNIHSFNQKEPSPIKSLGAVLAKDLVFLFIPGQRRRSFRRWVNHAQLMYMEDFATRIG